MIPQALGLATFLQDQIRALANAALAKARLLSRDGEKCNTQHFVETPVSEWFLTCGELVVTNPHPDFVPHADGIAGVLPPKQKAPAATSTKTVATKRSNAATAMMTKKKVKAVSVKKKPATATVAKRRTDVKAPVAPNAVSNDEHGPVGSEPHASFWEEPRHQDGGASIVHMGITLFGKRNVVSEQKWDPKLGEAQTGRALARVASRVGTYVRTCVHSLPDGVLCHGHACAHGARCCGSLCLHTCGRVYIRRTHVWHLWSCVRTYVFIRT